MEGGGGRGLGPKKVYLMSQISEYLLYIVLLIIEYVCCLYRREKSSHMKTIPFYLLGC